MVSTEDARWMESDNAVPKKMDRHFSKIAKKYRNLRTTDSEPVSVIVDKLKYLAHIEAVDVGCGDGRYDLLLYKHLGDSLNLTCLDANEEMLKNLSAYLTKNDIVNFSAKRSNAETMPFRDNCMDCIMTFNAVHHFDLPRFLKESSRVLKNKGYLFVYTRLKEQNERNIWGQHFPRFTEKETRLYSLDILKQSIDSVNSLAIESIVFFAYSRMAHLEQLLYRAGSHHYSTFSLYSPAELEEALKAFSIKIRDQFEDPEKVHWFDENVLFIIKKSGKQD